MTSSRSRSRGSVASARAISSRRWSIVVKSRAGVCSLADSPTAACLGLSADGSRPPAAPAFVRFWTKDDKGGFWAAMVCPLFAHLDRLLRDYVATQHARRASYPDV